MNLRDDNQHGEIAYDERTCPACYRVEELVKRIEDLEDEALDLKDQIREMEKEGANGKE